MIRFYSLLVFLFFLVSCAQTVVKEEKSQGTSESQSASQTIAEAVLASSTATASLPTLSKREPTLGFILGPGLNRTSAHIAFLRALEKRGIKIQYIEGLEMGAIVAALYAQFKSAERVEWYFYKYFRKNEVKEYFSTQWLKGIEDELLSPFPKALALEDLKIKFILPLYQTQEKRLQYRENGPLHSQLLSALTLSSSNENDSAAFEWGLFNSSALKKAGADIVIAVDVLGEKIVFRRETTEMKNLYEKVRRLKSFEKKYVDYFVTLPTEEMPLDGLENLPLVSKKTTIYSEKIIQDIQALVKRWKENNP